jgi:TPR repeat protein
MSALVERGNRLLAAGDIASAREFFERAVESGDATASYGLGKSYDPLFLQQIAQQGVAADATKAAWYRRAAASGNAEAAKRLTQLLAKYPPGTTGQGSSR